MVENNNSLLSVSVTNLGGINSLETSIPPGVTVLSGNNATNRTSFLSAIATALGAEEAAATLKTDADEGEVTVTFDDQTASRTFTRSNGTVSIGGDPLSEESEVVDTFVSVFSTNPARKAIRDGGENLREVLMRNVDTASIKQEVRSLKQQKKTLESQLEDIERAQEKLSREEQNRQDLTTQLEEVNGEIEDVKQEIENFKATSEEIEAAEEHIANLEDKREDLRRVKDDIDNTEDTIDSLEEERKSIKQQLDSLSVPENREEELKDERESLKSQINTIQNAIAELSDIITHNRSVLDEGQMSVWMDSGTVTESLDPSGETVECWTCGSEVDRSAIDSRIDTLVELRKQKNAELQELQSTLEQVEDESAEIREKRNKRDRLQNELDDTEAAIESEKRSLEDLESKADTLRDEVDELQTKVAETEELRDSDLPDAYERLSELEHDRGRIETKLERTESTIEALEEQISQKEDVEAQITETKERLEEARGRIDRIERDIIEKFNSQMDELLGLLEYENITRVWLERLVPETSEDSEFELHIVREAEDGSAYEDTVDTLSESEREVIGITTALSGYLVHDVAEEIPIILFDSVEAIDAERLEKALDHIGDFATYLVVALLPEDAESIRHQTIGAPAFS
ncbi:AAA family ATPase [Halodesulfurarchaeum sp. HSR-GB]|uniref:archaea-specific SMC-related protein n=1 Tax=Halodesulfurarchaeum sp. HSR-GB TaxID=3074077 RepID=UPI00285DD8A3|nr:archaea-specific SMC-related protein [Halodesulfurarchaeum sp. HSR-GB]MDR5657752.1 AAA family ATPase [Halodesulfurarchaeum sp. HSR-GB]